MLFRKKPAAKPRATTQKTTKAKQTAKPAAKTACKNKDVQVKIKTHTDNKGGHPHVILGDIEDKHISVGLTHDKYKGKNHKNYPLEKTL